MFRSHSLRSRLPPLTALLFLASPLACDASTGSEFAPIPLQQEGRAFLVSAQAGGTAVRLLVGTGREHTALTRDAIERLGLAPVESQEDKPGAATLPELTLGAVGFAAVPVQVFERHDLGNFPDHADGILGLSLFSRYQLTLDLPRQRLVLSLPDGPPSSPAGAPPAIRFELQPGTDPDAGQLPTIPVRIAGETHLARLDTTSPAGLQLPASLADNLPLAAPPGNIGLARTNRGEFAILGGTLQGAVALAGHTVERPALWFSDLYESVTVGYDALDEFALIFDFPRQTVRLERPDPGTDPRQARAARVPEVEEDGPALREAFNADAGKVRLLLILSPT